MSGTFANDIGEGNLLNRADPELVAGVVVSPGPLRTVYIAGACSLSRYHRKRHPIRVPLRWSVESGAASYLQAGSPSPAVPTTGLTVLTPMAQLKFAICVCEMVADQ